MADQEKAKKAKAAAAPNVGGRPPKEFDKSHFEGLCNLLATEAEICQVFKTTDKTLNAWCKRTYKGKGFSEVYKELSAAGKMSYRRKLRDMAMKGNTPALIFACKSLLGLKENPVDPEERELKLSILKLQEDINLLKLTLLQGGTDASGGKQVIIINDTLDAEDEDKPTGPGADSNLPPDNS